MRRTSRTTAPQTTPRAAPQATARTPASPVIVQVSVTGTAPNGTAAYARDKIAKVAARAPGPILDASVRITVHPDPAVQRPVLALANVDLNGRPVQARVEAPTVREAVDLLAARLGRRLDRMARHREASRGRMPVELPHEWRHQSVTASRPAYFPRDPAERQIIPRRSFTRGPITIDEAAFELDLMDHDFHVFTEAGSGQDSVLYRSGPTGLRLAQVNPVPREQLSPYTVPLSVSEQPAPLLSTDEAAERLDLSGLPFLFYLDTEHVRGSVLYRRYDGHYGLITPAG